MGRVWGGGELARSTPEAEGLSSGEVLGWVEALEREVEGMHSVMLLRHGAVVAEGWWAPYSAERRHVLYSLSKSFTSTAMGFAISEGEVGLYERVVDIFPEALPGEVSSNLRAMRVKDLLTMTAGHGTESPRDGEGMTVRSFLGHPVPHLPGTHFMYNTPATFMVSAIVQKRTGQTVLDYLGSRLFEPLGIEGAVWDVNAEGISLGGYGLRVRTEDIAKLGQLYLQRGEWEGRRLLSGEWVEIATSKQVSNGSNPESDWNQGYGFQFWRCRHGAYRGDGAAGQYCVVMPEQDAVVAVTSGIRDMQKLLDVTWDKLLPAFRPVALPEDAVAAARLRAKLGSLEYPVAEGVEGAVEPRGIAGRVFRFEANETGLETLELRRGREGGQWSLDLQMQGERVEIPCGVGRWEAAESLAGLLLREVGDFRHEAVAGSLGFVGEGGCNIRVVLYDTPFSVTFKLRMDGDELVLEGERQVSFGPLKWPVLRGRS